MMSVYITRKGFPISCSIYLIYYINYSSLIHDQKQKRSQLLKEQKIELCLQDAVISKQTILNGEVQTEFSSARRLYDIELQINIILWCIINLPPFKRPFCQEKSLMKKYTTQMTMPLRTGKIVVLSEIDYSWTNLAQAKIVLFQHRFPLQSLYQMEEFYRRKYLSPAYSRGPSYLDTLQKDKTVAELRKELQDCKEMQQKFDDLCLQIVRLERENKKIESQQSQVEGEYLEKIKRNKIKITELKQSILDSRENIEDRTKRITAMQSENDQLLQELQRIKREADDNKREKADLEQKVQMQEELIKEIKGKIEEAKVNGVEVKKQNQLKSEQLEKSYQDLKKNQLRLKEEELHCEQTRGHLQILGKDKEEWEKKIQLSQSKLQSLQAELELQNQYNMKSEVSLKQATEERSKYSSIGAQNQKELEQMLISNKQGLNRIKTSQSALLQSIKSLSKDQGYLSKVMIREVELRKGNQRLEQVLKALNETLAQQQQSYTRIIGYMKNSIAQDEKAIQSLSKQANVLQTMIN